MTVTVHRFGVDDPFSLDKLNDVHQALVSAINALAGDDVLQLGVPVDSSPQYMPKTGGEFLGQIKAPSILIGVNAVVTRADTATTALAGVVKAATAVADIATAISNPPTQAEVTAIKNSVNSLLAALRVAGSLAP